MQFSGVKEPQLRAAVNHIVGHRRYRTIPNIGEINDALTKSAEISQPRTNAAPDWKRRLQEQAKLSSDWGNEYVVQSPQGIRAHHEGWCRSCADVARGVARSHLMLHDCLPTFQDVRFSEDELAYYQRNGQSFGAAMWKQIGGRE